MAEKKEPRIKKKGNPNGDREMTILEHLDEVRKRLVYSTLALAITTVVAFAFTGSLLTLMKEQLLPPGHELIFIEMTENFVTYFKVALFSGAALAMPVFVYQLVRFVAPALTGDETRYLRLLLPGVALFFFTGVAFSWFVTLPFAARYLVNFGGDFATAQIRISNFVNFVILVLMAMGIAFQTPIIIYFLAKIRVVNTRMLTSYRKFAILGIFIIAAIITPTPDPLNQSLVAIPMIILYELGILLSRIA